MTPHVAEGELRRHLRRAGFSIALNGTDFAEHVTGGELLRGLSRSLVVGAETGTVTKHAVLQDRPWSSTRVPRLEITHLPDSSGRRR